METGLSSEVKINTTIIKSYKSLILGLLFLIVSSAVSYFISYPLYNKYLANKSEIELKVEQISVLDKKLAQLEKVKQLADTIEKHNLLTEQAIASKDDIPVVMTMIQLIAENSGVAIESFSYSGMSRTVSTTKASSTSTSAPTPPGVGDSDNDAFKMNISVKGKFDDVLKFIQNLEDYRRLIDVSSFSYSAEQRVTEDSRLTDGISLRVLLTSFFKDFSTTAASTIDIDKHLPLIQKLESMNYEAVDLSDVTVGKDNPFSPFEDTDAESETGVEEEGAGAETDTTDTGQEPGVNTLDTNDSSSTDVEANPGDVNEVLQEVLQQEGVQQP